MKSKKIALVFICRNNEDSIAKMIDSCLPIVDEIYATDTGSTDKTKEIINSYADRVPVHLFDSPWINFGHNRTIMMENAESTTCDYYFVMDTDETITITKDFEKDKLTGDAYLVKTLSGDMIYYRERLLTTKYKWPWKGAAHEHIVSDKRVKEIKQLDSLIMNVTIKPRPFASNIIRNYKLLLEDFKKDPDNSRTVFYLGESCRDLRWLDDSIEYYKKRIKMGGYHEEIYYSMLQIGIIYGWISDIPQSKDWLYKAIEFRPRRPEAMYELALILQKENHHDLAVMYLERIINMPDCNDSLFVKWQIKHHMAEFQLSVSCFYSGYYDKALEHALKLNKRKDVPEDTINQNRKNIVFYRRKWNEIHPDQKEYVLETPYPAWDGLGDHLFISPMPKILKEKMGFKKVWISNFMKYKTPGVKQFVWEDNPYVDGFIDEYGMIDDYRQACHEMMRGATNAKQHTVVNRLIELYLGNADGYNPGGLPWINKDRFRAYKEYKGKKIFDGYWKSFNGLSEELVLKYFERTGYPDYQVEMVETGTEVNHPAAKISRIVLKDVPVINVTDLQTYGGVIASCGQFVCMMSGGGVLAAAIRRDNIILDSRSTRSDIYRFYFANKYEILDDYAE